MQICCQLISSAGSNLTTTPNRLSIDCSWELDLTETTKAARLSLSISSLAALGDVCDNTSRADIFDSLSAVQLDDEVTEAVVENEEHSR